jgi:hypothetical protein
MPLIISDAFNGFDIEYLIMSNISNAFDRIGLKLEYELVNITD